MNFNNLNEYSIIIIFLYAIFLSFFCYFALFKNMFLIKGSSNLRYFINFISLLQIFLAYKFMFASSKWMTEQGFLIPFIDSIFQITIIFMMLKNIYSCFILKNLFLILIILFSLSTLFNFKYGK